MYNFPDTAPKNIIWLSEYENGIYFMPEKIICSTWKFRAYESNFFQPRDGKLPLIFNVQIRGEIVPSYLKHTHTHTYTITHLLALRFSHRSKVGEVQRRANPLSNFDSSHRRFPPPTVAVRVTRQARNVVIAEIMAMPTARCGERNDGDYVTLKFNFAIVLRTRGGIPRNFDTVS